MMQNNSKEHVGEALNDITNWVGTDQHTNLHFQQLADKPLMLFQAKKPPDVNRKRIRLQTNSQRNKGGTVDDAPYRRQCKKNISDPASESTILSTEVVEVEVMQASS